MAIYEYLKASNLFVDLLDKQNYQKEFLESRVEKAQKILNLFPGEESNHNGLKIWKEYFNQH